MADGETIDTRDRELEELRRENAHLKTRVSDLERQVKEILGKLDEALRANKRQDAPSPRANPIWIRNRMAANRGRTTELKPTGLFLFMSMR